MSSRRRFSLVAVAAVAALLFLAYVALVSDSPEETAVIAVDGAGASPARRRPVPAAAPADALREGDHPSGEAEPSAVAPAAGTATPTSSGETPVPTPEVRPLALQAADEYRRLAQFPPWSRPFGEDGEDPILRDREVTMVTAAGPEGVEPILTVFPEQVGFEAPDAVVLYAFLTVADSRIPAAQVTGVITGEDLQPLAALVYRDDGAGGDAVAGDLIYTARFAPPPEFVPDLSDTFLVRVQALTEDRQERIAATGFLYSNPHAQLTGRYRDSLVDGSLAVDVEVEVRRGGRFHLEATLYSRDARRGLAEAQTAGELAPGRHWMRLAFFGRILQQSGVDGPYLLRFVALSTTSQMPNAKNRLAENPHLTAPYRAADFSPAPFEDPDLIDAADRLESDLPG